jgi:SAM-dependent methyltransferase
MPSAEESAYWDSIGDAWLVTERDALWRCHSDALNAGLIARWLPAEPVARLLKTDLFDEAVGAGLASLLGVRADRSIGMDISPRIASAAQQRAATLTVVCADVRRLPFATASFDSVVSNSTLDHFADGSDIRVALCELCRVLRPGGRLLLTIDNAVNPVIALRGALPQRLLQRLGMAPYAVGATVGPGRLRRLLAALPLDVQDMASLLHCPRALAVACANRLRHASAPRQQRFLQMLLRWERFARWPTRWLSGYYVAVLAIKHKGAPDV